MDGQDDRIMKFMKRVENMMYTFCYSICSGESVMSRSLCRQEAPFGQAQCQEGRQEAPCLPPSPSLQEGR